MTGAIAALPGGAFDLASTGCHHCGEPLPTHAVRALFGDAMREFCCSGCAAAAEWIRDAELDDYYLLRRERAGRVDANAVDLGLWDRPEVQAEHAHAVEGGREITLLTDGMRCAACAWLIDRALAREPGVLGVSANAVTGRIRLSWDPARTALSVPLRRLVALGYRPCLAQGEAIERMRRQERNRDLLRLGVAGLGAMQAMMFAEALYLDTTGSMPAATRDFFRWITLLVSTPVVFYSGMPFITGWLREMRERQLGMDTLIATSTLLAFGASVFETLRGGAHVWFDAAVMFVFLMLAARMLERRARRIATAQVDALTRAQPAFATREDARGGRETVAVGSLAPGDVVCIAIGECVPADGVLLDAATSFEEALLTGESRPVARAPGEPVLAGATCRERPARVRVTHAGSATRLSQLARLVDEAQSHRPAVAQRADRVAGRFVAGLLIAAVAVYAGWSMHEPSRALEVTLALLVISCPCALSLSVPAALATAHGTLARLGVLAVRPDSLERLAAVTDVVFDKTGTLSDARTALRGVRVFDDTTQERALAVAAALERDSGHPIAAAFMPHDRGLVVTGMRAGAGAGVEGIVDGRRWRIGQAGFAADARDDGAVWLGDGVRAIARFELAERARGDAASSLAALRSLGLRLHLASGDGEAAVRAFAGPLDLERVHARQSPEDKLALVRALQRGGRITAMVGDGINDAPVLAGADVSFAIGGGTALAQRAADFVLAGSSLARIPQALDLARRTRRVIAQNLGWALAYNLVALPLAAAGLVTPWVAALGMALSSLIVTGNALRLTRGHRP